MKPTISCTSCGRCFVIPVPLADYNWMVIECGEVHVITIVSVAYNHKCQLCRHRDGHIPIADSSGRVCAHCALDIPIDMLPVAVEQP